MLDKIANKLSIVTIFVVLSLFICSEVAGCRKEQSNYKEYIEPAAEKYARMTEVEQVQEKIRQFHSLVMNGEFEDLRLTIFCTDAVHVPDNVIDAETLLTADPDEIIFDRIDVESSDMMNNKKWLLKLDSEVIESFDKNVDLYWTPVYYVVQYKNEILFEVALWGSSRRYLEAEDINELYLKDEVIYIDCVIINNVAVEKNDIFCKFIMPFLPEYYFNMLYDYYAS